MSVVLFLNSMNLTRVPERIMVSARTIRPTDVNSGAGDDGQKEITPKNRALYRCEKYPRAYTSEGNEISFSFVLFRRNRKFGDREMPTAEKKK